MLTITVPGVEHFDEETEEFYTIGEVTLELEHSLVSLSKWESKWEKPFLKEGDRTDEEVYDYIKCMVLTPDVSDKVLSRLSADNIESIKTYIDAKMTATWFPKTSEKPSRETITSELVYYWMIALQIPWECQHWHLNRLFTLIRVCNVKNSKPKPRNDAEAAAERHALNQRRKAEMKTRG